MIGNEGEAIGASARFVGEVTGDGVPDFAGLSLHGVATLYSGLDGSVVFEWNTTSVSTPEPAADRDGDGVDDVRFGAEVVSGVSGGLVDVLVATGTLVGGVGDLDGDGRREYADLEGSATLIRRGSDGTVAFRFDQPARSVAAVGDVNGDGVPDFGLESADPLVGFTSVFRVVSGLDGSELHRFEAVPSVAHQGDGQSFAGMGDLDFDGRDDFAIASIPPRIFSGATGCKLAGFRRARLPGDSAGELCYSLANAGDVDGDGRDDLIAGNLRVTVPPSPEGAGSAAVFLYGGARRGALLHVFTELQRPGRDPHELGQPEPSRARTSRFSQPGFRPACRRSPFGERTRFRCRSATGHAASPDPAVASACASRTRRAVSHLRSTVRGRQLETAGTSRCGSGTRRPEARAST